MKKINKQQIIEFLEQLNDDQVHGEIEFCWGANKDLEIRDSCRIYIDVENIPLTFKNSFSVH